jgi:hypothetical protein
MEDLKKTAMGLLIALGVFILKEIYSIFKANISAITSLNVSLIELKTQVQMLTYQITPVAKIKEDLNALHTKMRVLEAKQGTKPTDNNEQEK